MQEFLSKHNDDIDMIFYELLQSLKEISNHQINYKLYNTRFNEDFVTELYKRKIKFEENTGLKETSSITEPATFSEIVKFILENKKTFNEVFSTNPRSYDFLSRLSHLYQKSNLTDSDRNDIVGMSWYVLKQVQEWQKGKTSDVLWYSTDLSFDSTHSMDDSIAEAKTWFSKLESSAKHNSEVIHPNLGLLYRLDYDDGPIFVTNPIKNKIYLGDKIIHSARVRILTQYAAALDHSLALGDHSYGNLSFTLRDDLDLRSLNSVLNLLHENDDNFNADFVTWGGIEYNISKKPSVLVSIMPENKHEYRIRIIKQYSYFNKGFVAAHKFFSPKIVFEILLGLRDQKDIKNIIQYSSNTNESLIL